MSDSRQSAKVKNDAPPVVDERDATIERLERSAAEERDHAAKLRVANEELRFKLQIIEKGYTKQLADARLRAEKAEKEVAEHKSRLATVGSGGEDTMRLLSDIRAELTNVTIERNELRAQLARREGRPAPAPGAVPDSSGTINAFLTGVSTLREEQSTAEGAAHLLAKVRVEEAPPEDMIAPDLVFTKKDAAKDDDDA